MPPIQTESAKETPLPPLRANLNLHPSTPTIEGIPTWVIYDPVRHRYFNIGRLEFEILRRWKEQTIEQLIWQINQETSFNISNDVLMRIIKFLTDNQLLKIQGQEVIKRLTEQAEKAKQSIASFLLHRYLFFRIPLFRPDNFLNATLPVVKLLFTRSFAILLISAGILGIYLVSRQISVFLTTFSYFFSISGMLVFIATILLAKIIHELGHGYAAKYHGLRVPTMGVAFMVMWPILYTDASDAWKLTSRRQRFWIDSAGIVAELSLALIATFLWSFLPDGMLRSAMFMLAVTSWIMTLLVNLNPFMRFDGYYMLSDYLGINNLQERSFAIARWWLREKIFGFNDPIPERFSNKMHIVILFYAFGTWIYRFFLFLGIALIVYFLFLKIVGIFLMLVELIWFLFNPIYKEIRYWFSRRKDMRLNKNTLTSSLILILMMVLLITPWQTTIEIPAIYKSKVYQDIYAPMSAKLAEIKVETGQLVKEGETLLVLKEPDIEYQLKTAQRQENSLKLQLELQASNQIYLEQVQVLQQQLAEVQAEIQGYQSQLSLLTIRATFDGEIVRIADGLRVGRWINPALVLARLVDKPSTQIVAYVTENNLDEIAVGYPGRLYPDNLDHPAFNVKIKAIDAANVTQLQQRDYYIASIYQGTLPVKMNPKQKLIPQEATYYVYLSVSDSVNIPNQVYPGKIVLDVKNQKTLLERAWILITTVLIRESGF